MATVIRELAVKLAIEAENFNNGLKNAQREAKEFEKTIKPTTQLLADIGAAATSAGKVLTVAFTAPIVAIAGLGIAFNAMQEQAQIAFTTMLGDGQRARVFLGELKDFAAKTPFEFPDLVRAAQRLMAMGFAAKDVKPLLTAVGDAVAGLGGGAAEIDRVTLALGQMQGRGKVATQEMNQLTEVGIPAWKMLAVSMNITEAALRDMVEKGTVPAGKAVTALLAGMADQFGGMAAKQAETFSGLISTMKDESRFLAGELTEGLFATIKGPAGVATDALHGLRVAMDGWSDSTKAAIGVIAGAGAALGPGLVVFGQMSLGVTGLISLFGKLSLGVSALTLLLTGSAAAMSALPLLVAGAAILAMTAAVVGLVVAMRSLKSAFEASNKAQDDLLLHMSEAAASTEKAAKALKDKYGVEIKRGTMSTKEWSEALGTAAQTAAWFEGKTKSLTVVQKANTAAVVDAAVKAKALTVEVQRMTPVIFDLASNLSVHQTRAHQMFDETANDAAVLVGKLKGLALERAANESATNAQIQRDLDAHNKVVIDGILKTADERTAADAKAAKAAEAEAQKWQRVWENAMGNVVSNFAQGVTDMIFEGKNFADSMKELFKDLAKTIIQVLITDAFTKVAQAASGLISGGLGKLLGIGGSAAGGVASTAGSAAGSIGGAVGGVGSAAGGMVGSMAGGLVSGGLAAVGSIIGAMMGEGNARRTEENTRETRDWLELQTVAWNPLFHEMRHLMEFKVTALLQEIKDILWEIRVGGGQAAPQNLVINMDGRQVALVQLPHLLALSTLNGVQIVGAR